MMILCSVSSQSKLKLILEFQGMLVSLLYLVFLRGLLASNLFLLSCLMLGINP